MATVKNMNFKRGRLGDIGFRQQITSDGNGQYSRKTVAFQIPDQVTNPRSPGQVAQRTKFKLIQVLATTLTALGILRNFYNAPNGLSGYNAFIRDNLAYAIDSSTGIPFVDFRKLQVTFGDFYKNVSKYQPLQPSENPDCNCRVKLAWNHDWTEDPNGDYVLVCVGIKIGEDGAVEGTELVQPRTPMAACTTEVELPNCECCKTYWYAYFVDPTTGYFSTSSYIGTCECELPVYEEGCITCNPEPFTLSVAYPPEECTLNCSDKNVDKSQIFFNGKSRMNPSAGASGGVLFTACPMYGAVVTATLQEDGSTVYSWVIDSAELQNVIVTDQAGNEHYDGSDNSGELEPIELTPINELTFQITSTDARCNKTIVVPASEFLNESAEEGSTGSASNIEVANLTGVSVERGSITDLNLSDRVTGNTGVVSLGRITNNSPGVVNASVISDMSVRLDALNDGDFNFDVQVLEDGVDTGFVINVSGVSK